MKRNMVLLVAAAVVMTAAMVEGADLSTDCSEAITKLTTCLTYATGKGSAAPSKECCASVKAIKESEPKCLCYIMQQANNGSDAMRSMGIQKSKLLTLPSACQLQNASVSYCPKLLGIPANSPDAAIFGNSTSSSTTTPLGSTAANTAPDTAADKGSSNKQVPYLVASIMVVAMAITTLCGHLM